MSMQFEQVRSDIEKAAAETKEKLPEYDHDEYTNEMHEKLSGMGYTCEKEKSVSGADGEELTPDIFVEGHCVIQLGDKGSTLHHEDREQMDKYVKATGLYGILVNFGTGGNPHTRVFR